MGGFWIVLTCGHSAYREDVLLMIGLLIMVGVCIPGSICLARIAHQEHDWIRVACALALGVAMTAIFVMLTVITVILIM